MVLETSHDAGAWVADTRITATTAETTKMGASAHAARPGQASPLHLQVAEYNHSDASIDWALIEEKWRRRKDAATVTRL